MSFLEPQMTLRLMWTEFECAQGGSSFYAPSIDDWDHQSPCCQPARRFYGWGVRASSPGYLDCTEWEVFENKAEAELAYRTLRSELAWDNNDD